MENGNDKNKDPEFIKEVVKEKKKSKKSLVTKAIYVIAVAAAAALVAGVIFAFAYKGVSFAIGGPDADDPKVSIEDDSSDKDVSDNSPSENSDTSVSSSEETSEQSEIVTEIIYDTDLTLDKYEQLYSQMHGIAAEAQKSLVTVTGITSQLDYFNESYENEQMNIGLIVAESQNEFYILTYYDIIENVANIRVTFEDKYSANGALQRSDPNTGFAVIKVEKEGIPEEILSNVAPSSFGTSSMVRTGDPIIVIGNPDGYDDYIAYGSVTSSSNIISLYDTEYRILTTNIPDGSQGIGIVLDLDGNVIGITSEKADAVSSTTMTALSISGIRDLIETLSNNEARAYAGVRGSSVTEQINEETGIPRGIIVTSIAENSPAMMSGMMEYDIITAVDGNQIMSMEQYIELLKTYEPGTAVNISVMRQVAGGYTPIELTLQLGEI
ncbi:MAG TPA: serine protease [Candidatus Alectryocaccobium stercorigallinarum]|nr:serine protease [Candidatus Alectryocaccobium stercorigallinarum]